MAEDPRERRGAISRIPGEMRPGSGELRRGVNIQTGDMPGMPAQLAPLPGAAVLRQRRIEALSQELGIPIPTAEWIIDQERQGPQAARRAMGSRSRGLAAALEQRGTIPAAADVAGLPLGELLARAGEVREDPLNQALRALNAKILAEGGGTFVSEDGYERDLETGAIVDRALESPTERPIDASTLSAAELAALLPASERARAMPYAAQALGGAERQSVFENSGASRTRGGSRNSFAKEPNTGFTENPADVYPGTASLRNRSVSAADPDARYSYFTPGNVVGAGLEPNPASAAIPLLVSPRLEERFDTPGQFQAPNVYLKNVGGYVKGLADARILDVNPLAQLSPQVADALGARLGTSFYTAEQPDKSETGGYAGLATNAPIPDPATGGGGFQAERDPATSRSGTQVAVRPMTVAEAVSAIATRNLAPISSVMVDQLVGDGQVMVTPPKGQSYPVNVFPLRPPAAAAERELSPAEQLRLQAEREQTNVVQARVGSRGRYQPGLYEDLDQLVGLLAAEAFPDARGRFQLQSTASDLATREPITTGDRYKPTIVERPVGSDWSLLINSASKDPLVSRYQAELLGQAGIDLPADRNPLISLVDNLTNLAGVPAPDVAIPFAESAAQRVNPADALLENALRRAKVEANRSVRGALVPSETGAGVFAPETTAFSRQNYERNARTILEATLRGRIPLGSGRPASARPAPLLPPVATSPQVAATGALNVPVETPIIPGLEGEIANPQITLEDSVTRDLRRYMASRAPAAPVREPQTVVQFVPEQLYSRFSPGNEWIGERLVAGQPGGRQAVEDLVSQQELERMAALRAIAQRATPAQVFAAPPAQLPIPGIDLPYSATGLVPDPADQLASYMARRAAAEAAPRGDVTRVIGPNPVVQYELRGLGGGVTPPGSPIPAVVPQVAAQSFGDRVVPLGAPMSVRGPSENLRRALAGLSGSARLDEPLERDSGRIRGAERYLSAQRAAAGLDQVLTSRDAASPPTAAPAALESMSETVRAGLAREPGSPARIAAEQFLAARRRRMG